MWTAEDIYRLGMGWELRWPARPNRLGMARVVAQGYRPWWERPSVLEGGKSRERIAA